MKLDPRAPRKRKYLIRSVESRVPRPFDPERIARELHGRSREELIREAAYTRAALRAFAPGDPVEDWLAAEREIDARLAAEARRARSSQA